MKINFKKSYKKISKLSVGEKINIANETYILTDNKNLINIETGKTLPLHLEDEIETTQTLSVLNLRDYIKLGDMFLDGQERLFLCTGEHTEGEYYCLSENVWYDLDDFEYDGVNFVWLVPKESIEITITAKRPY